MPEPEPETGDRGCFSHGARKNNYKKLILEKGQLLDILHNAFGLVSKNKQTKNKDDCLAVAGQELCQPLTVLQWIVEARR